MDLLFQNFPSRSYLSFEKGLNAATGLSGFDKLASYYTHVLDSKTSRNSSKDIVDRMNSGKFFYYPEELGEDASDLTCFENSVHFLMAAQKLYPESKPRLAYIDEGTRGTHSVVTFNHKDQLYGGDFSYKFLGPINFEGSKLRYGLEKEDVIKLDSFTSLSEKDVSGIVNRLRGKDGIKYFLSEGGQPVVREPETFRPYEIFSKFDNLNGKFISELRFRDFDINNNTVIRREYNLEANTHDMFLLKYGYSDWSNLVGETLIARNKISSKIGDSLALDKFTTAKDLRKEGVLDFIKPWSPYHDGILRTSRKNRQSMKNTFTTIKKFAVKYFEGPDIDPGLKNYLDNINNKNFSRHVIEYLHYRSDPAIIQGVSENKQATSWRDLKRPNHKKFFQKIFTSIFFDISKKEMWRQSNLDSKIMDSIKI